MGGATLPRCGMTPIPDPGRGTDGVKWPIQRSPALVLKMWDLCPGAGTYSQPGPRVGDVMQLNETLARQIVSRAMKILSFSVNVMDERADHRLRQPERLHQRHEGAVLAPDRRTGWWRSATPPPVSLGVLGPASTCPSPIRGAAGVIGISGIRHRSCLRRAGAHDRRADPEQAALTEQLQGTSATRRSWCCSSFAARGGRSAAAGGPLPRAPDLAQPRVVAVLALEEAEPARLRELVHLLENPERDNLVAINGLDEIVVLKPAQLSDGVLAVGAGAQPHQAVADPYPPLLGCASGG